MDVLALNQSAWLATRPQGIKAKRRGVPRRRRAHGRAAYGGPARLMQRRLEGRPLERAVAQKDHLGPRRILSRIHSTTARWRSAGKGPFGAWRTRPASSRAR